MPVEMYGFACKGVLDMAYQSSVGYGQIPANNVSGLITLWPGQVMGSGSSTV